MADDHNKIALKTVRAILDAARPEQFDVGGTAVQCEVARGESTPWPSEGVRGLDPAVDGPWPQPVDISARWEGGRCALRMAAEFSRHNGAYRHNIAICIRTHPGRQQLVWIMLPKLLQDAGDRGKANV